MNAEKLRQVLDYCDVYEFIAAGTDSMKSLDEEMRGAVNSSALQRRRKWITESPAYLTIKDDRIIIRASLFPHISRFIHHINLHLIP